MTDEKMFWGKHAGRWKKILIIAALDMAAGEWKYYNA
jgi:hypothetical protein